jgi:hypothetical protein
VNKKLIFSVREFVIILLSGGVPVLLSYQLGGLKELENTISGMIAPDILLYCSLVFPLVFVVFYFLDKYIYVSPLGTKQGILDFTISTLYELSMNIIGIFRLICGVMIAFPFLVLWVEPESAGKMFASLFIFGVIGGAEVALCYWLLSKARLKQVF